MVVTSSAFRIRHWPVVAAGSWAWQPASQPQRVSASERAGVVRVSYRSINELAGSRLGFERLRAGQLHAVAAAAGGRDLQAVLPTGGGKSAIYELAGLMRDGPTAVVSPVSDSLDLCTFQCSKHA
jgi:hypothetical protein